MLLCQLHIANCMLPNHQLHIGKLSTTHCECYIVNFPSWLHFSSSPNVLQIANPAPPPPQNLLVCSMSKIYSLGCPYKIVTGSFSIHHLLHTYPPTSYLPTYPSCYLGPCWEVYNFTSAHFCKLTSVNCQVSKLTHDKSTCTLSHAHWHVFKCTLHIATCMLPSF
jgi:hypothetical protein